MVQNLFRDINIFIPWVSDDYHTATGITRPRATMWYNFLLREKTFYTMEIISATFFCQISPWPVRPAVLEISPDMLSAT